MMSDMMSVDSGPDSEYNFGEFGEEESKEEGGNARRRLSSAGRASSLMNKLGQNSIALGGDGKSPFNKPPSHGLKLSNVPS